MLVAALFLPPGRSPWPDPGTPTWDTAHTGWLLAIPVTLAALAIAHRDTRVAHLRARSAEAAARQR